MEEEKKENKQEIEEVDNELLNFIDKNEQMIVQVSPGVSYSLRQVTNESYRLLNARLYDNEVDDDGFINIFSRKMWVVYRTLIQGADLDMKDSKVTSNIAAKQFVLDLLKMLFHSHMKNTFFGEFMDKIKEETAWFGSSIIKRYDGTVGTVDLRNYITEPHIKDPQERRHAELWFSTFAGLSQYKEEWKNWDAVEDLWEKMQVSGESQIKIIDFWTFDESGKKICKRSIDNTLNAPTEGHETTDWNPYVLVDTFSTPYRIKSATKREKRIYGKYREMFPYEQVDLFNIPGRMLGLGCGELLASPEMMYDQLFNTKRKMDMKALMGIIVHTAVQGVDGLSSLSQDNISGLGTGTVISLAPGETLNQLPFDTKGYDFSQMEEKIYELMLQLVGITAQGTGQTVAPSTSATQIQDNRLVENKVYEHFKERMHHGLNRLMLHGYAQDMIDELSESDIVGITGDIRSLKELDTLLIDNAINSWMLESKDKLGYYPIDEEVAMVRKQIEKDIQDLGSTRYVEVKKALFDLIKLNIEWNFVDESIDMRQKMDTLNALRADPTSTKSKAKIEDELVSLAGLNPSQYEKTPEEIAKEEQARKEQIAIDQGLNQPLA